MFYKFRPFCKSVEFDYRNKYVLAFHLLSIPRLEYLNEGAAPVWASKLVYLMDSRGIDKSF